MNTSDRTATALAHRTVIIAAAVAAVGLSLGFVWFARRVLLLAFAGALLGVFLRRLATEVSRRTGLGRTWCVGIVTLGLAGVLAVVVWWRGPDVMEELGQLRAQIPAVIDELRTRLEQRQWARRVIDALPDTADIVPDALGAATRVTGVLWGTLDVLGSATVILFIGIVLAGGPDPYVRGFLALVPRRAEARTHAVLQQVYGTLWWWLLGRLISMSFIGLVTGIGLWLLGIPLAFVLALLAALLSFIPNLGPILSFLPAILLAMAAGRDEALAVSALYAAIQVVESYLLAPLIDRRTIAMPPALTIVAQLVFAMVGGVLGVALATPLAATGMVVVSMLYVQDVLGRRGMSFPEA